MVAYVWWKVVEVRTANKDLLSSAYYSLTLCPIEEIALSLLLHI